jgi:hypothetical protein
LSPFVFSGASHLFFAGNTSAFLLLLALGTSLPMILGAFLVRPIPLPVQDNFDSQEDTELEPHNSSHAPLLDHDFAQGVHSKSARVNNEHFDESYALDDVSSHQDDETQLSSQPRSFNQGATMMLDSKPNLHGLKLWLSGDFWLHFTILGIRKSPFVS